MEWQDQQAYLNRYGVIRGGGLSPKFLNAFLQDLRKYLNAYRLFRICREHNLTYFIITVKYGI